MLYLPQQVSSLHAVACVAPTVPAWLGRDVINNQAFDVAKISRERPDRWPALADVIGSNHSPYSKNETGDPYLYTADCARNDSGTEGPRAA